MMTDRFDSQLRQHLLGTADERPADGQLAAVAERVAATAQRMPLVARLTWFPGRIGPFPSAAVRYGLLAVALALAAVAAVLIGGAVRPPSTVFEGTWMSIDPFDASTQFLEVGAGSTPAVRYIDELATGGACDFDTIKRYTADGSGAIAGNRLDVVFPNGGGCGLRLVEMGPGTYRHDVSTDIIVDGQGVSWTRVPAAFALPSRAAVAPPTSGPTPATPPLQDCFDIPAGETYRNDVGGLSLTVTIPAAAAFEWQGFRDAFNLTGACFWEGPVGIDASIVTTVAAACDVDAWVDVSTPAEAVAALADAPGFEISQPTTVTLGGHAATRFEVAPDARTCFAQVQLWNDATVRSGTTTIMYLVDVDGLPLGISIHGLDETLPALEAEAEAIVASLQVGVVPGPHSTSAPVETPDPGCIQFHGSGTYTAPVGPLSVSATLPDEPDIYWHGLRDTFYLFRSPCLFWSLPTLEGSLVTQVPADACHWERPGTRVADAAAAAAALAGQAGTDATAQTELTIDGHAAVRLGISVAADFDSTNCDGGGQIGLWPTLDGSTARIQEGEHPTVYLVDVEGSILAITVHRGSGDAAEDPALLGEIDSIIGSLQIKP